MDFLDNILHHQSLVILSIMWKLCVGVDVTLPVNFLQLFLAALKLDNT